MGKDPFESSVYARCVYGDLAGARIKRKRLPSGSRYYIIDHTGEEVLIDYKKGGHTSRRKRRSTETQPVARMSNRDKRNKWYPAQQRAINLRR